MSTPSAAGTSELPKTPPKNKRIQTLMEEQSTPLRRAVSSTILSPHTRDLLDDPLVREVEQLSLYVDIDVWVEGVCRVPSATLKQWSSVIKAKNTFADAEIQKALLWFCGVKREPSRYVPLSDFLNRLLALVDTYKSEMKDLPDVKSIPDLVYFRNDPNYMVPPDHQGELAAQRKPDVVGARMSAMLNRLDGARLAWAHALFCIELKLEYLLTDMLSDCRQKRGLPPLKESDLLEVRCY